MMTFTAARRRTQTGTGLFGEVFAFAEVPSTSDVAFRLLEAGAPEGTVVVASAQSAGRGRRGAVWHSPPAGNIYFSVILRPPPPTGSWPDLSWVLGAAVAEALRSGGAPDLDIKRPNDVLAGGRKIAGILLESRHGAGSPAGIVAGAGVNVNMETADLEPSLRRTATSLRLVTGRTHDTAGLFREIGGAMGKWYRLWENAGGGAVKVRMQAMGIAVLDRYPAAAREAENRKEGTGAAGD